MNLNEEINVKIGEIEINQRGDILKATLGSCVGIAFYWPEKKMGGLAHCLLPWSAGGNDTKIEMRAKYVSQAIPSLIRLMNISFDDISKIQVAVVGGSHMMSKIVDDNLNIGKKNVEAAKLLLQKLSFDIKKIDTGGFLGRKIFLDCNSGFVDIEMLEKLK